MIIKIARFFLLCLFITSLTSCMTGSTLRTAHVLEPGQFEISGGIAHNNSPHLAQVIIGAYGITENIELEGRYEDQFVAVTPRLQLLRSENACIDCLTFFELGYSDEGGFQFGPGIIFGKRWKYMEPYLSYRYRHFCSISNNIKDDDIFRVNYLAARDFHYVKFGNRFHIPCFWKPTQQRHTKWFIGIEVGPAIFKSDVIWEWAANIGFDY